MPKPTEVADRYIERGGYVKGERHERVPADILAVANFVGWHDEAAMWGGVKSRDAFAAFCRLIDFDPIELRRITGADRS